MSRSEAIPRLTPGDGPDAQGAYHARLSGLLPAAGEVLDLGCGDNGELARYRTPARAVWGTDLHEHPHLRHRDWFRPMPGPARLPFDDGRFDVVTAAWVMEHVTDPAAFCREVARVLKPGGRFVGLTPHARHYVTWLVRAVGLLPHRVTQAIVARAYGRAEHDTFPTVYRLNTTRRIAAAARAAGLEPAEAVGFANPDYFRFARLARSAAVVADGWLDRLHFGLGRLYLVVVLRKPGPTAAGRSRADRSAA